MKNNSLKKKLKIFYKTCTYMHLSLKRNINRFNVVRKMKLFSKNKNKVYRKCKINDLLVLKH